MDAGQTNAEKHPRRMTLPLSSPALDESPAFDSNGSCTTPTRRRSEPTGPKKGAGQRVSMDNTKTAILPPATMMSLWSYFLMELEISNTSDSIGAEIEQVANFVKVPIYLEKTLMFGFFACLNAFMSIFAILPIRIALALPLLVRNLIIGNRGSLRHRSIQHIQADHYADLIKGGVVMCTLFWLFSLDTSRIYHVIRGQAAIKLYVLYNVLEIGDKLLSALGQDVLESLLSKTALQKMSSSYIEGVKILVLFCAAIIYNSIHSVLLFYMVITLNVAANSYSNALLALLLSNQFGEIKAAVFKRFDRESLFQLTCADITERFQLWLMLVIIGIRNLAELTSLQDALVDSASSNDWWLWVVAQWISAVFGPSLIVLTSEVCVDWLKHAYVTKFNNIRPKIYVRYLNVLCYDYSAHAFSDFIVTKRVGLPILPLACVFIRTCFNAYKVLLFGKQQHVYSGVVLDPSQVTPPATVGAAINISSLQANDTNENLGSLVGWKSLVFAATCLTSYAILLLIKLFLGILLLRYSMNKLGEQEYRHPRTHRNKSTSTQKSSLEGLGITNPSASSASYVSDERVPGKPRGYGVIEITDDMRQLINENDPITTDSKKKQTETPVMQQTTVTTPGGGGVVDEALKKVHRFKMVAKRIW